MRLGRAAVTAGAAAVGAVAVHDLTQRQHAILRNFPVVGHLRYLVERFGPELRQYIVASNDEERPFSRDQRRWIYASAKLQNPYFGFGTDNDVENVQSYPILKHRTFLGPGAATPPHAGEGVPMPSAKVLGGPRGRAKAFRPHSVVNVSAMSFGSLSAKATEAINRGAAAADALHNTGEGAISPYHRQGADLVFQIGTAYFGCRDEQGRFDLGRLKELVDGAPVKALEIKLSQGAKPGMGGMLPAAKVSDEIAEIRGIPVGEDCASPSRHTAFGDVDSMLDFVELLAAETGLPVGIKSAVGNSGFWDSLVEQMADRQRGVDFITVDGGEGGTGAAPLVFADSIAYPFRLGFTEVYKRFATAGLTDDVTFIGGGKLGLAENASVAFGLGVDMVNVAREAMMAVGCIQAMECHTGQCPTGVATQSAWLQRGLDPDSKSERMANYLISLRRDLLKVCGAIGVPHPGLIAPADVDLVDGVQTKVPLAELYGYQPGWGELGQDLAEELWRVVEVSGAGPASARSARTTTDDEDSEGYDDPSGRPVLG